MDAKELKNLSKFMSLVLRHRPELGGLTLDPAGWTPVEDLLKGMAANGHAIDRSQLEACVAGNDKQRFEFHEDGTRIRARQGHTVDVELGYAPAQPPATLLHGTPDKFVDAIRRQGLIKRQRHHVHLHEDAALATQVGERRGSAVVLRIDAKAMAAAGHEFFVTANQVWLTDSVPPEFISFPD